MSITGDWTLHFNWGNTNAFAQAAITLNGDGTIAGAGAGKWYERDGRVLLSWDGGPAKYGGTINDKVGSGAMTTFGASTGTWYLSKAGTAGATTELVSAGIDARGVPA